MKTFTGIVTVIIFVMHISVLPVCSAPSSKNASPHTVFDQKQTGDYNIQLHLKDFQIIALLAGDSGLGDYDYNYDYSDFTIKPPSSKPPQPTSPSSSSSTGSFPTSIPTSSKPSHVTQQPLLPSTSSSKPLGSTVIKPEPSAQVPEISTSKPHQEVPLTIVEEKPLKIDENSTADNEKTNSKDESVSSTTTQPIKLEEIISPGKIKVQIIETPVNLSQISGAEPSLGQNKDINVLSHNADEVLPRKCASGYARDQKGRCRRLRKPSGSSFLGFSRLANNIASRFVKDSSSSMSVESSE